MLYLHEVLRSEGSYMKLGGGTYNINVHQPREMRKFPFVFVGQERDPKEEKYFVDDNEIHCGKFGATRTLGIITTGMILGFGGRGGMGLTTYATITLVPQAWDQLVQGKLEAILPRKVREHNAGNHNLESALSMFREDEAECAWLVAYGKPVEVKKLDFTTVHFDGGNLQGKGPSWKWDRTDEPVRDSDWAVVIDPKGYLWARLFERGEKLDGPPPANWQWVRETDSRFWLKTAGRSVA